MSVKSGTLTWCSFAISDPRAAEAIEGAEVLRRLDGAAFRDPNVEAAEKESDGFVVFDEILSTDFEAASEKVFVGSYVLMTYRRDRLRIPAAYLKALVRAEEQGTQERTGRNRLGRVEKTAIREKVEAMLLRRALPAVQTADVVWSLTDATVRIFAGSAALAETAAELFEATFELDLLPREPFVRLLDAGRAAAEVEALDVPIHCSLPALLRR